MSRIQVNELVNATNTASPTFPFGAPGDFSLPLRLYATSPANAVLNIAASEVEDTVGGGRTAPPSSFIVDTSFSYTTIDFQTNIVTPPSGVSITFPTTTSGQFRRVGFSYSQVTGLVTATFSAANAVFGSLPNPGTLFPEGEQALGWVDLEGTGGTAYKTAGSATSVIENKVGGVVRIHTFVGGGGGGGPTSDELQDIYTNTAAPPATITTSATYGAVVIAGTESFDVTATGGLNVTQSGTTQEAISAAISAGASAQTTVAVTHAGTGTGLSVAHTGTGVGANINLSNATNASNALTLDHAGLGKGIDLNLTNASNNETALDIAVSGGGKGIFLSHGATGNAIAIDLSSGTLGRGINIAMTNAGSSAAGLFIDVIGSGSSSALMLNTSASDPTLSLRNRDASGLFLRALNSGASGWVNLKVPGVLTTYDLTLPGAQGANNQTLVNDGAGVLSWGTISGGDTSLQITAVTTPNATINSGYLILEDGRELQVASPLSVNLTTILGGSPANATAYYLYIDLNALPTSSLVSGRKVYVLSGDSNFSLQTTTPDTVNLARYVPLSVILSATSGNAWSGTGAAYANLATRRHDGAPVAVSPVAYSLLGITAVSHPSGTNVAHNANVPTDRQQWEAQVQDSGGLIYQLDPSWILDLIDANTIKVDFSFLAVGDTASIRLIDRGTGPQVVPLRNYDTGVVAANTLSFPLTHGLPSIPTAVVLLHEVSAGVFESLAPESYVTVSATQIQGSLAVLGTDNVRIIASVGAQAVVSTSALTASLIPSTTNLYNIGSSTFTWKELYLSSFQQLTHIATPATPAAGLTRVYAKADGKVYRLPPSGVEAELGGGAFSLAYTEKTSLYTAVAGDLLIGNTSGGSFTINLPAAPAVGTTVIIVDGRNTWSSNNLTVGRNGSNILSSATDLVANVSNSRLELVYTGGSVGWNVYSN